MLKEITCPVCSSKAMKEVGSINRAKKKGAPIFCSKECCYQHRRKHKTLEQRKAEKRDYDKQYRAKNADKLRTLKATRFRRDYDPIKAAEYRKSRMHIHLEYCRTPKYKKWKADYDKKYLAKKKYGEFSECHLLAQQIREECLSRMTDYEIRITKGTFAKSKQRKRSYERLNSNKSEKCPLGHAGKFACG